MKYVITILIIIIIIASLLDKVDDIRFSILVVGLTIMNMILRVEDKIEKLSAAQKEKEEKR